MTLPQDLIQRLQDGLNNTLRKAASADHKDVDTYLTGAMERLTKRPHSLDEIKDAKKEWDDVVRTLFALNCSPSTPFALNRLPSTVCPQLFALRLTRRRSRWQAGRSCR